MELVNYLAQVWGISIAATCLAMLIKEKHLKRLFASLEAEDNLFSWGLASMVIGLAMILNYNIWSKDWKVVITIIGWISLLKGLSLLFVPELSKKWVKAMENKQWLPYLLVIGVIFGLVITYFGFTA